MPQIKVNYVVSFSSEDPEHPARGLASGAADGSGRWLVARPPPPSASVLLQLPRATKISRMTVGAHHAALVEVLVGRSETPDLPFQVLVASCVFVGAGESRRGASVERVRSFHGAQLQPAAAQAAWDRVRLVVSQPYNKHCQYGLSFVHLFEPEESLPAVPPGDATAVTAPAPLTASLPALAAAPDDDDEEFRPGALFSLHRQRQRDDVTAAAASASSADKSSSAAPATRSTETEIRRASVRAMRHQEDVATPPADDRCSGSAKPARGSANERHKQRTTNTKPSDHSVTTKDHHSSSKDDHSSSNDDHSSSKNDLRSSRSKHSSCKDRSSSAKDTHSNREDQLNKTRDGISAADEPPDTNRGSCERSVLRGVVFALSGYANPRRARLRSTALALGAAYREHWGPQCTHLICAFPNTPKMREARAANPAVPVVKGEWLERCAQTRRRVPWQPFATDPKERRRSGSCDRGADDNRTSPAPSPSPRDDQDGDTDDEIERALARRADAASRGDVTSATDEGGATPPRGADVARRGRGRGSGALPALFAGRAFAVAATAPPSLPRGLLRRYVHAYGGLLLEEASDEASADYVLCGGDGHHGHEGGADGTSGGTSDGTSGASSPRARAVRADWVWRCHERRALAPLPSTSTQLAATD